MNSCTNSFFVYEFMCEFVKEFFRNFVPEFMYKIRMNFLHENLVMLRMACTVGGLFWFYLNPEVGYPS